MLNKFNDPNKYKYKAPKSMKCNFPENLLNANDLEQIKKFSDEIEYTQNSITLSDVKKTLLMLGMPQSSTSFKNITNSISKPEYEDKGIPITELKKAIEAHLGFDEEKNEMRKIFDLFTLETKQDVLSLNDFKKILSEIDIEIDEVELNKMIRECCADYKNFTFDDFHALMSSKETKK